MKRIRNHLITGLVVLLPLTTTLYVLWRIFIFLDNISGKLVEFLLGYRVTGFGALLTLLIIFLAGFLTSNYLGKKLYRFGELIVYRIPLANTLYRSVKQIVDAFAQGNRKVFQQVVLVEFPSPGRYAIAFITGVAGGEVREKAGEDLVNVFLPTTPNPTSGFLLLIPKEKLTLLEMTVEEGLKMIISGGVVTPDSLSRDSEPQGL